MTPEHNPDLIRPRIKQATKKNVHTLYILAGLAILVIFVALIIVSVMKRNPMKQSLLGEPVFDTRDGVHSGDSNDGVFVDTIDVMLLESFPVQAQALVRGNLADGCTVITDAAVRREGTTFIIDMRTTRQGDMCTQALVPFERSVALPVAGLAAGTYTVQSGQARGVFTMQVNNTPVFESDK